MKRAAIPRRHLDTRTLLDYLDGRLDASDRRRVEDHLGGSCTPCRERLLEIGRLVRTMRADRSSPIPDSVRARALRVFGDLPEVAPAPLRPWRSASLVFDSAVAPLPAMVRRSTGEARWLRYALGEHTLEIEAEPETTGIWTLRGRLDLPEPALHHIEIEAQGERLSTWPDAGGRFALEHVPAGPWAITVRGPEERFRLPTLDA